VSPAGSGNERAERWLQTAVDAAVCAFAGWTAGYQIGFLLRLPAAVDAGAGLVLALAAVALLFVWRDRQPALPSASGATAAVALVLGLGAALAVLSTLMSRPDADDITFFTRAAAQLSHLGAPILTSDVTSNVAGLPGPSIGYLLTSYEFLVALVGHVFGLDPLSTYHNAACALASALVPAVYYLVLRRLGLAPLLALAGAGGASLFLLLDGADHHSMGNMSFVRLWQGKAILLTLLLPYLLGHTIAYLRDGGRRPWWCIVCAGIAATGLTTIGCFFAPAAIGTTAVAVAGGLLVTRQVAARDLLRRGAVLLTAVLWPAAILAATLAAPVPGTYSPRELLAAVAELDDSATIMAARQDAWYKALLLPTAGPARAVWALVLVATAPLLALTRRQAVLVAAFVPVFLIFVANPLSGGLLFAAVPDVYWRFAFLLPVPLGAGLVVVALARALSPSGASRARAIRAVGAAGLIAVFVLTFGITTMSPDNAGFTWKSPAAWKLDPRVLTSLDPWLPAVSRRTVLADEPVAVALTLADPSVRMVAQRPPNTLGSFVMAGHHDEGSRRVRAQSVVAGASAEAADVAALREVLAGDVDVVVVRTAAERLVAGVLVELDGDWRRMGGDAEYSVWVRTPE
jgi:hypothetical protein